MIELGLRPNFASEIRNGIGRCLMERKDLDRALATHQLVDALENLAHSALADEIGDDIRPQRKLRPTFLDARRLIGRQDSHFHQTVGQQAIVQISYRRSRSSGLGRDTRREHSLLKLVSGYQTAKQGGVSEDRTWSRHASSPRTREGDYRMTGCPAQPTQTRCSNKRKDLRRFRRQRKSVSSADYEPVLKAVSAKRPAMRFWAVWSQGHFDPWFRFLGLPILQLWPF